MYYLISPTHALFDINNLIIKRINLPNIILQDANPILLTFKTDHSKLLEYMHTLYYNIPTIQSYMNEDINNNYKKKKNNLNIFYHITNKKVFKLFKFRG